MDSASILVVSLLVLMFALVSKRLQRTIFTPPMIFVTVGLIVGAPAWGLLGLDAGTGAVHAFAELTLVIVLFTDAARIDVSVLRREYHMPMRLLAIGMPLTILLGALVAWLLFPVISLFEAALLGAILAPTDAALGQAVISNRSVPARIRQALNVESGLNDGIALPVVLALAACAEAAARHDMTPWIAITAKQLLLGPAVGVGVGWVGPRLVGWASCAGWMSRCWGRLAGPAVAFLAFAAAEGVGGNGFISAFVAGLTVGNTSPSVRERLSDFTETEGHLLVLITFFLVGALLVWSVSGGWTWRVAIYSCLSLSAVRMVPVALSLAGMRLRPLTTLFVGWFGPRGLASILFAAIIVGRAEIPHRELIFSVVIATALASIFAHGVTAFPAARRYGRRLDQLRQHVEMPEDVLVTEHRVRVSHGAE